MDWGNYDRSRFAPEDPDGKALDAIQFQAWLGLVAWLMKQQWAHAAFAAATSRVPQRERLMSAPTPAEAEWMLHYASDFTRWATAEHWGEDEITPSIREALNNLPRQQ